MKYLMLGIIFLLTQSCAVLKGTGFAQNNKCSAQPHLTFKVLIDSELLSNVESGRLIILMSTRLARNGELMPFFGTHSRDVWVAAKDITELDASREIHIDPVGLVFPNDFCAAPEANYYVKAILDMDRNYAYSPVVSHGDLYSDTIQQIIDPSSNTTITLNVNNLRRVPSVKLPAHTELFNIISPTVSAHLKQPTYLKALVVLPPGYSKSKQTYPTVYFLHGYGADLTSLIEDEASQLLQGMKSGQFPEMIWVLPLYSTPKGIHVFADSENNGPWATTLINEMLPELERRYRMDAKTEGRFLTGISSGGWATLWLQVNYPDVFGGSWAIAPDPVDFRNFVDVDLTQRPSQNFYYHSDGSHRIGFRVRTGAGQTLKDMAQQERVFGEYGGQVSTFEAAFSPRDGNGNPMQLFDRDTGIIDSSVADHWIKNYDISSMIRNNWATLGLNLNDKIHLIVGTEDNMYLNESARLMENEIKLLNGTAEFKFVEERNHFDVLDKKTLTRIINQMYSTARPN